MNGPFWNIRRKQRENSEWISISFSLLLPNLDAENFSDREREREIAFHVSFSLAALRERAKPFIPGSLLKSRVSGTVSMVHDTSRKLNRSRGRVITSRLLERKKKKKKAAVCWEGRNKGREKEGGMLAKDLRSLILPILCPNDLKTRAYASGSP